MANRRMFRKFERILKEARLPERRITLNESRTRIVLFSDHHKGDGSPADDFKKNAALYSAALDHYAGKGFKLLVIGDNEELWESEYGPILTEHQTLIEKEIHLALENLEGKKIRIWGNHDKEVTLRTFRR